MLTNIDIINLVVNWLNETKLFEENAKLIPTMIAYKFGEWLNEKGVLKDVSKSLLERSDLEKVFKKSSEDLQNIINTLNEQCSLLNNQ